MSESQTVTFKIWRGDPNGGAFQDYMAECSEGWSCSTLSIKFSEPKRTTSPVDGIARQANADRARPK